MDYFYGLLYIFDGLGHWFYFYGLSISWVLKRMIGRKRTLFQWFSRKKRLIMVDFYGLGSILRPSPWVRIFKAFKYVKTTYLNTPTGGSRQISIRTLVL